MTLPTAILNTVLMYALAFSMHACSPFACPYNDGVMFSLGMLCVPFWLSGQRSFSEPAAMVARLPASSLKFTVITWYNPIIGHYAKG